MSKHYNIRSDNLYMIILISILQSSNYIVAHSVSFGSLYTKRTYNW